VRCLVSRRQANKVVDYGVAALQRLFLAIFLHIALLCSALNALAQAAFRGMRARSLHLAGRSDTKRPPIAERPSRERKTPKEGGPQRVARRLVAKKKKAASYETA
jgi:hypothetical protein